MVYLIGAVVFVVGIGLVVYDRRKNGPRRSR